MTTDGEVTELMNLGLTQYEAKSYLALVGRESATPAEVARLANIPRQRSYDVLASMAERGLVVAVSGTRLSYQAQRPQEVMSRLISLRRRDLEQAQDQAASLTTRLTERFIEGQGRDGPLSYVEVLRDRQHSVARIEQLWEGAENEILTFVRPPYLAPPSIEEATLPGAASQRAVYELSLLDQPELVKLVQAYTDLGEQVRLAAGLPLKLTIVDGTTVAFNMPDPVEGADDVTTLVVHHPMLAETLKITFQAIWREAVPLEQAIQEHSRVSE